MLSTFHIVLAMKPLEGNFCQNAIEHGVAGINIDGCRIGTGDDRVDGGKGSVATTFLSPANLQRYERPTGGRWPANLILEDNDEVTKMFPETTSGAMRHEVPAYDGDGITGFLRGRSGPSNQHGDSGSAARFFKQVESC